MQLQGKPGVQPPMVIIENCRPQVSGYLLSPVARKPPQDSMHGNHCSSHCAILASWGRKIALRTIISVGAGESADSHSFNTFNAFLERDLLAEY